MWRKEPKVNIQAVGPHTATASKRRTQPCHQANLLCVTLLCTHTSRRRDGARTEDVPTGDGQEDCQGPLQLQCQQECRRDSKLVSRRVSCEPARADLVILATQMFLDYIVFMQTCANTFPTMALHEINN